MTVTTRRSVLARMVRLLAHHDIILTPEISDYLLKQANPIVIAQTAIELLERKILTREDLLNINGWKKVSKHGTSEQRKEPATIIPKQAPQSRRFAPSAEMHPINRENAKAALRDFSPQIQVIRNIENIEKFRGTVDDFVEYFRNRYQKLSRILRQHGELANARKIATILPEEEAIVIGMITEKRTTKNGHVLLEIEDETSSMPVLLPKSNRELLEDAQGILLDTVLGFIGKRGKDFFIARKVIWPDVPHKINKRTAQIPVNVAFLSDIHVGSQEFLEKTFLNFINFLRGKADKQSERILGLSTKYVLFAGDVVDGIGIYPNQQYDLVVDDINDQYDLFAHYLDYLPEDVTAVIIPGNHDMVRRAEPQPIIPETFAKHLHSLPNVVLASNPSMVALHGVKVLLYHCTPLMDLVNHLPGHSFEKPGTIMREMLRARHLSPLYGEHTPIAPEKEDHLVIEELPDIFHGGHVHINDVGKYRGIAIVNSGTMQAQTEYQRQLNIVPTPGKVTLLNLQTFGPRLLDFYRK